MKKSLNLSDIKIGSVVDEMSRPLLLAGIAVLGLTTLPGCIHDSKSCSDVDQQADPAARYDRGPGADPTDIGLQDADTGVADPGGAGDRCADFD